MTIRIRVKNIYGKDLFYPVNRKNELEVLTGKKTLSENHIKALKDLGFNFEAITTTI